MTEPLLELRGCTVDFRVDRRRTVRALDHVDLEVAGGEVLALIGESGSGKTTLGNVVTGLVPATAGSVEVVGTDLTAATGRQLRSLRRRVQMVFQDPYESLDPRFAVARTVAEPLRIHGLAAGHGGLQDGVEAALRRVGLDPEIHAGRYPHELSGGQRQRVAIAAAITLEPQLLVADEPVSMLDVSVRAEVLDLLVTARPAGSALLMITHDLSSAAQHADRIAVMYLGRIVEVGTREQVMGEPRHPYTRALLDVAPRLDPDRRPGTILRGEVPDASTPPPGCSFHPRCPVAQPTCAEEVPALVVDAAGHGVACPVTTPETSTSVGG